MKKYKIGYTTGVFDLFHIGHLNILRQAKELCDYLIVGVSTDELCYNYKNKQPIIPFNERVEIVKSIIYVDEVVKQENMNKLDAWDKLRYNVLFHGDDWKDSEMYIELQKQLQIRGVDIVFFSYTQNTSSSRISKILCDLNIEEKRK